MKRFLFTLALVLTAIAGWAAGIWTPVTNGTTETPLYIRVCVNDTMKTSEVEVAAFIDGECRASATSATEIDNTVYRLRVTGTEDDMGKDITFKALYKNIVYTFTTTEKFDGETETHGVPFYLDIDAVMGFEIDGPIVLETALPAQYNLGDDVVMMYCDENRHNISTVETEFTYTWSPADASMTVDADNVLTATAATSADGSTIGLTVTGPNYSTSATAKKQYTFSTSVQVIVIPPTVDITFNYPDELTLRKFVEQGITLTNLAGDNFDKNLITFEFANSTTGHACASATMSDETGLNWTIIGLFVGDYTYRVLYNGAAMTTVNGKTSGTLHIPAEFALNNAGWDWISLYAYDETGSPIALTDGSNYLGWLSVDDNNRIIEIRSQTALLYNDKSYGFIGDITELSPKGGMYKVKATYADAEQCILNLGTTPKFITATSDEYNTIQTGYTWISYPQEMPATLAQTNVSATAKAGDKIIGLSTSAEFDGTQWLPTDFVLMPGKGYIYYTAGQGGFRPDFTISNTSGVKGERHLAAMVNRQVEPSPWQYKVGQFADNMPIVAALEGESDGEQFSIGAYVGDECRGEGRAVDGNIFIINVAGVAGETVHFRLYNKTTGEFSELSQTLPYTSQCGSLQAPVALGGSDVVDGISTLQQTTVDDVRYNLAGQRVGRNYRGVVIVNGKKSLQK